MEKYEAPKVKILKVETEGLMAASGTPEAPSSKESSATISDWAQAQDTSGSDNWGE